MNNINDILNLIKDLEFEEAISHRIHSRVFEILGYASIVDKEKLPDDVVVCLTRIEELSKTLINEIHLIIDYYKSKNPNNSDILS